MIKNQVYAGIGLALMGIMLFILVSPILYYESPIGIHLESRLQGVMEMGINQSKMVDLNVSYPYVVVGYNYTVGPLEVQFANSSMVVSPISVEQSNRTIYLDYQLKGNYHNVYTLSFYNNASQTQTINYEVVQLRFGNLVVFTLLNYVEIVMFIGGIIVAAVGAFRKPKDNSTGRR
ncbi:hypothetical protein B9Q07_09410 [Candidatus Marsarchaeota G2 archaeon ECH_B_3]|uniref:Uncharacterized protein n=3 Tax=Candidatus Marsarchaeota group 2 TaxID=2203771 RepID=A0A2R6BNL7_9ARCH|nr:MAG: hypothetical protein B9Q07_09410 [Candidatus Marsarchaeota G2 archaeon ECH_B_3]PSO00265.1 MAG: hypothetical protein B9Q05_10700 [Candidatus Marsarchaeota G2 archaeon ECH_B_1]